MLLNDLPFYTPISPDAAVYALELVLEAVLVGDGLLGEVHPGGVSGEGVGRAVAGGERPGRAGDHAQRH